MKLPAAGGYTILKSILIKPKLLTFKDSLQFVGTEWRSRFNRAAGSFNTPAYEVTLSTSIINF
jgi:hypothetical protein